jgi:rubredoxin
MEKWKCLTCGYVYDPSVGDSNAGIPAGTSFENLPSDWICPVCEEGKEVFEKE